MVLETDKSGEDSLPDFPERSNVIALEGEYVTVAPLKRVYFGAGLERHLLAGPPHAKQCDVHIGVTTGTFHVTGNRDYFIFCGYQMQDWL